MKNLRKATRGVLAKVEEVTGKSIQFLRDEKLSLLATLQIARNGADYHVLRYRPSDEPVDYFVVSQAAFVLRLFENEPSQRFDFAPDPAAAKHVETLLKSGQALGQQDIAVLPQFAQFVAQWAMMNLRSLPISMRIDRWIATEIPDLRDLQSAGIAAQQQQNADVLAYKLGNLSVPVSLLGMNAAYALFADRLAGSESYAIPYEAMGILEHGKALLRLWDETPPEPNNDWSLVDKWAKASGLSEGYKWIEYRP